MNVGRHARIAQRPYEHSVEVARQHVESVRRDGGAVDEVSVSAPVERGELECRARGAQHVESVGDDFLADSVTGDDGDAFVMGHGT